MEYEEILRKQFDEIVKENDLNRITEDTYRATEGISDYFSLDKLIEATIEGESIFNNQGIIEDLTQLLLYEIKGALSVAIEILIIIIFSGLLNCITESFKSKGAAKTASFICNMIIVGIAIKSFYISYELALNTVSTMVNSMAIILPVLITVLIATGMVTTGTVFSPMISAATTGFSIFIKNVILPLLLTSAVLTLLNSLTEKDYVNKLAKMARTFSVTLTGLVVTLMSSLMSIQGLLTESSDNLLLNTAKYSLSTFIPLVGGFTSDTAELFLKCMSTIKNVIGVFGVIIVILLVLIPVLKIFIISLIYKLTSAVSEPITDKRLSDGLDNMGNCMISIGAVLLFTSLLYILFIGMIIGIGGN